MVKNKITEINRLENEFEKFGINDYSLSENGGGEKSYAIHSEELKQSLRDIIHPTAYEGEWQIKHTVGKGIVEYLMEKNDKFGFYQKSLGNSDDKFFVLEVSNLSQNASSPIQRRREEFIQSVREVEKSRRDCEESRKECERQRRLLDTNFEGEDFIAFNFKRNEKGEWVGEKQDHYSDPEKGQEIREGWAYNFTGQLFKDFADKGIMGFSNQRDNDSSPCQQIANDTKTLDNKGERENFTHSHQIPPKK